MSNPTQLAAFSGATIAFFEVNQHRSPKVFAHLYFGEQTTFIKCPSESIKTKEMTRVTSRTLLQRITQDGIFRTFFSGWSAIMLRQSISWVSFLVSIQHGNYLAELVTSHLKSMHQHQIARRQSQQIKYRSSDQYISFLYSNPVFGRLFAGTYAGIINTLVVCPFDSVACHFQKDSAIRFSGSSTLRYVEGFRYLYQNHGLQDELGSKPTRQKTSGDALPK